MFLMKKHVFYKEDLEECLEYTYYLKSKSELQAWELCISCESRILSTGNEK